ncbi:MAG: hypothetical protein QGD94_08980, partial [Planctomycetia bacterium]|nr:hypothetical protein [Planctomycetia bacterium]
MTAWTIVRRSLRFYWRTNLSVVLASAVGTAVLVGALTVGDSVRGSLERLALARLGNVELALAAGDRYFRADLAGDMQRALGAPVAPALVLGGSAANADGSARAGRVQVVGADERFWKLGPEGSVPVGWAGEV